MKSTMKSYSIRIDDGRTVLDRGEAAVPAPGAGQVLVRVHAAGLNRGEFIAAHGLHAKAGPARPAGTEGAGEIAAVGADVAGWKPGDRVMFRCGGAFAEYALVDARETMAAPQGLSWEEAAAVPLSFLVVHDMLIAQGRLRAGEWLLVTGVASGVGCAALQTAQALGARVIGTSGSAQKLARLSALGLDVAINTRAADFCGRVMEATGKRGADLVVNAVGGTVFAECVRSLAYQGRLATVGYVDGVMKAEIDLDALHAKRLTLFGVSNKLRSPEQRASGVRAFVSDLLPLFADGRLHPLVDRIYPFDELPEAKAYMESNAHLGKIVVRMG